MKIDRTKIFTVLFAIFFLEIFSFYAFRYHRKEGIVNKHNRQMDVNRFKYEKQKNKLINKYEKNKYRATGKNVYERIYNRENQNIIELINNLSKEALPKEWSSEVRVEEFTNFVLLIHTQYDENNLKTSVMIKHLIPIVKWATPYLQNVAFFNKHHRCIFYLDEKDIQVLKKREGLRNEAVEEARRKGEEFTLFNSVRIQLRLVQGHMFIPVTVYGDYASHDEMMMLDTGASMTVLPKKVVEKTFNKGDDKIALKQETFSTAKGTMICPIIDRNIVIGGIDKFIPVAINENDNISLLGMNFFNDKNYIIDTKNEYIYIWDK